MSNTYFKIEKHDIDKSSKLYLTAYVGSKKTSNLQLTITSKDKHFSGTAYYCLSDEEIDLLIAGLLERKLGKVSATGDEKSNYCPSDE